MHLCSPQPNSTLQAVTHPELCAPLSADKRNEDGKARIFLHHSSVPYCAKVAKAPVTEADVKACQKAWAEAIKSISKVYLDKGDYVQVAADAAGELYGYGHGSVLFKPTKAAENPFRPTASEAMSYFVGHKAVKKGYKEDGGFAINSGDGWKEVLFKNHQIDCQGDVAIAMGTYTFTSAATGEKVNVEYTFGCDPAQLLPSSASSAPVLALH